MNPSEAPDQGIDKTINSISRNKPPAIDLELRFEFSLQGPPDQQRNEQAHTVYGIVDQESGGKQDSQRSPGASEELQQTTKKRGTKQLSEDVLAEPRLDGRGKHLAYGRDHVQAEMQIHQEPRDHKSDDSTQELRDHLLPTAIHLVKRIGPTPPEWDGAIVFSVQQGI